MLALYCEIYAKRKYTVWADYWVFQCSIIIIIINNNCNWVVTRWQWLFYMHTKYEIVYY